MGVTGEQSSEAGGHEQLDITFEAKVKKLGFEVLWDEEFPAVGALKPEGAAQRRGVTEGDVLWEIQGTSTQGRTRAELLPLLKERPLRITLRRVRKVAAGESSDDDMGESSDEDAGPCHNRLQADLALAKEKQKLGSDGSTGARRAAQMSIGEVLTAQADMTDEALSSFFKAIAAEADCVDTAGKYDTAKDEASTACETPETELASTTDDKEDEAISKRGSSLAAAGKELARQLHEEFGPSGRTSEEEEAEEDDEAIAARLDEAWRGTPTKNGGADHATASDSPGVGAGAGRSISASGSDGSPAANSVAAETVVDSSTGLTQTPAAESDSPPLAIQGPEFAPQAPGGAPAPTTARPSSPAAPCVGPTSSAPHKAVGAAGYVAAPASQAPVAPPMARMQVEVPPGRGPGSVLVVLAPGGQKVQVTVPPGYGPGSNLLVQFQPTADPVPVVAPPANDSQPAALAGDRGAVQNLLLRQDLADLHSPEVWAARMRRLNTTGMAATKVGRNSQAYKRTFWFQSGCLRTNGRNMCNIMAKDIKAVYKGATSQEFEKLGTEKKTKTFFGRSAGTLSSRTDPMKCCVLFLCNSFGPVDEGDRTLSLVFDNQADRDEFAETAAWYIQKMRDRRSLAGNRPTIANWQQDDC